MVVAANWCGVRDDNSGIVEEMMMPFISAWSC